MSNAYQISPAGFGWLAQAFPEKNAISPLATFEKEAHRFDESEKERLLSQDVIGPDGTIKPHALAAFKVLAGAGAFTRIRILGTDAPVDKVTYFKDGVACSVDAGPGYFTVTFPALAKEAGFTFEEFTGSSRLVNVPFNAKLPAKAALAFLALVDLSRAAAIKVLAGEQETFVFSTGNIMDRANGGGSLMWFVRVLKDLVRIAQLSSGEVLEALGELQDKGLAAERDGGYMLVGDALDLAVTLLIAEYVFNLGYGRMISAAACEQSECSVVFCGMHNLLYIDTVGDTVTVETISGSELLQMVANLLQGPPVG